QEQLDATAERGVSFGRVPIFDGSKRSPPTAPLPHAGRIARSFGRHDVSGVKAHLGANAAASAHALGAAAYATGEHVVFARAPDLRSAAPEAAHVIQQRTTAARTGDGGHARADFERHADQVAARVVAGQSAESLLDGAGSARAPALQLEGEAEQAAKSN